MLITPAAAATIEVLRDEHGPLMFHQSGGWCDGSSPLCFTKGEFRVGSNDVWLGRIQDCDFFRSASQFAYWQHTQLTVDVVKGRGASFSLEITLGVRFLIRSRLFTAEEGQDMALVFAGDEYPVAG